MKGLTVSQLPQGIDQVSKYRAHTRHEMLFFLYWHGMAHVWMNCPLR